MATAQVIHVWQDDIVEPLIHKTDAYVKFQHRQA